MGQRTQIVLKTKDSLGRVQTKVYHEQFGFKKTMLALVSSFLLNLDYGDNKKYTQSYRKPVIAGKQDLLALSEEEKFEQMEMYKKYSIHNLDFHVDWNVDHEYNENYINNETGEDATFNRPLTKEEEKKFTPLLKWDFDIFNPKNVWKFEGDNDNGMCLISIEEKVGTSDFGYPEYYYDVYVGFLNRTRCKGEQYITGAKYLDIFRYSTDNDDEKKKMTEIKTIYNNTIKFTEVEELGLK